MSGTDELTIVRALRDMEKVADPQMRRVAATFIEALAAQRDEAATLITSLREALERKDAALLPFAQFSVNTDDNGWLSNIHRESISTWFGPSAFRDADDALNPSRKETI
jgi:hypothetical protein